ncbi:MAG: helix-turn-helix domain-containing protein [Betaproteobacteria bacterium]
MSDSSASDAAPIPLVASSAGASAGTILRTAREAAGVHIGALAVALKVPVKKLEALEADDLAQLPDAVFARALAASVCRTLKIDPESVLRLLPQLHAASLPIGGQGEQVRLDNYRGMRRLGLFSLPKPVLWLTAALLVGVVVVLLLPSLHGGGEATLASSDKPALPLVVDAPALPAPVASDSSAAAVPQNVASAARAAALAVPVAAAASASPAMAEPTALALLTARAPSWVQVQGADGVVHLRKTLEAGETVRINGAVPLSVVIGRANAIDVQVHGKSFDLAQVTKDNVARFQIK